MEYLLRANLASSVLFLISLTGKPLIECKGRKEGCTVYVLQPRSKCMCCSLRAWKWAAGLCLSYLVIWYRSFPVTKAVPKRSLHSRFHKSYDLFCSIYSTLKIWSIGQINSLKLQSLKQKSPLSELWRNIFLNSGSDRKDALHGIIMCYPSWTGLVIQRKWSLCLTPPTPNAGWFPELRTVTYIFGIILEDDLDWINQLISHSADIPPPLKALTGST